MANWLNRECGKTISIGSSTSRDQDLQGDLKNRLIEDMCTHIERCRERHRREDRDNDIVEGCLTFVLELHQVTWPKKIKIDVHPYEGVTNPQDFL